MSMPSQSRFRATAWLALCAAGLLLATLPTVPASAAAPKAGKATKAAAPSFAHSTYAKQIKPPKGASRTAIAFAQKERVALAAAEAALAQLLAVRGPRTLGNTLELYNAMSMKIDEAAGWAGLFEEVHPDESVRKTASLTTQVISSFVTDLSLNRPLYDAMSALDIRQSTGDTQYLMFKTLRDFRRSGVDQDEATRNKIRALSAQITRAGQDFDHNIAGDTRKVTCTAAQLQGLPQDFIDQHKPDKDGKITITTDYPDYIPVMGYSTSGELRHDIYMQFLSRAYPANLAKLDTLVQLRDEYAKTLGYRNWAHYNTEDKMVASDSAASAFIDRVVAASGTRAGADYATLLARKQKDDPTATVVQPWEKGYYDNLVKREQYAFDSQSVRPYFSYAKVKDGILHVYEGVFGVTFRRVAAGTVPTWYPDVEVYDVVERGKPIGRFYLDMHPRANKYKHAAHFGINSGVTGQRLPQSALVCNLPGGKPGESDLMQHDDVVTFFHEFGHLMHAMFASQRWSDNAGTAVQRDFVEAPSQLLEEWAWKPEVLQKFATDEKGTPIPAELVTRMKAAAEYGKGLNVRQQMFYARLSLNLYRADPTHLDIDGMTRDIMTAYTPFPYVDGTHMAASFGHLNGYSANYYTYMWSLVIAKDMWSAFAGTNLLGSPVSMRYRNMVLAQGGSAPSADLVHNFLGRDYDTKAFEEWLNEGMAK